MKIVGGAIPSDVKTCPNGLRYRNGHCEPFTTYTVVPSDTPKEDDHNPSPIPTVVLDPDLTLPVRVGKQKVTEIQKTTERGLTVDESRPKLGKLSEPVKTQAANLNTGDTLHVTGTVSKHTVSDVAHTVAKVDSVAGRTRLALRAGTGALAALDIADTFLENLEAGMSVVDALRSIPDAYYQAAKETAEELYDAWKDQDYIRLGSVIVSQLDLSTPVTRLADLVGRKVGLGNIGSNARDYAASKMPSDPIKQARTFGPVRVIQFAGGVLNDILK